MFKIIIAYLNTASGAVVFIYVWESVMIYGVVSSARNTDTINSAIFMLKIKHHFHKPFPSLTERDFLQILVYFVPAKYRSLSDFFVYSVSWHLFVPLTIFSPDITGLEFFLNV